MPTVVLLGPLDTKGAEYDYARSCLRVLGVDTVLVDTATAGRATVAPDVTADEVAHAAGHDGARALRASGGRTDAQAAVIVGATAVVERLRSEGRLDAVMALGGSNTTSSAAAVMRSLPLGVPKLILTTMLSGAVGSVVAGSDLVLAASVADLAGLNRVTRPAIAGVAAAVAGMARAGAAAATYESASGRPVIACSMIGLTTRAVTAGRERLEELGYEVVVFHMTGAGGRAMEQLIAAGGVAGVLDLTTSELADELCGGVCSAGPERLRADAPRVVAPGGLDMINFGPPATVPDRLSDRPTWAHNAMVTLVRTSVSECAELGRLLVERVADGAVLVLPSGGLSALDEEGRPFADRAAADALRTAVRAAAAGRVRVVEVAGDLDRPSFGVAAADGLHELVTASPGSRRAV